MSTIPIRVSIFGSCVSRDTIAACEPDRIRLQRYIARQSLISAFNKPSAFDVDLSGLASPFQRKMIEADFKSSFSAELPHVKNDSDILLWDLIDERNGVYQLPDGAFVTRSVELINSGADSVLQRHARFIPFGTNEHISRWVDAFDHFMNELDAHKATRITRLLAITWANRDSENRRIRTPASVKPSLLERQFERYYATASARICIVRVTPKRRPVTPVDHRWGPAPYHYTEAIYNQAAAKLFRDC